MADDSPFRPVTTAAFYQNPTPRPRQPKPIPPTPATPSPFPFASSPISTQPRLRAKKRTQWQKMDAILGVISHDFSGLGNFLELLFWQRPHGERDERKPRQTAMVSALLGGQTNVTMGQIIKLIYNHRHGQPPTHSVERQQAFSHKSPHTDIRFARPSLSSWALVLVGKEVRRQAGNLTKDDPNDPDDITQLRASTNGRVKDAETASWIKLTDNLSIPKLALKYEARSGAIWYLTEMMAAPSKGGVLVLRQRRPHTTVCNASFPLDAVFIKPQIQVGAISSFVLSRNRYANAYLALHLAVWQFACRSHVDEKRIFSRFGFTVHDTTARACLNSLSDASMVALRKDVADGIAVGEMRWHYVLDNVQEWCRQRYLRLGRQDVLKVGCAATAILLEDCAPGAFDLQDHLNRVMAQERKQMTIESLLEDIDWDYIEELTALHWVRILVNFIPELAHLRKLVEEAFQSDRMTRLRLRRRISVLQPLGTNAEREVETPGMFRAMLDFEGQMGLDENALKKLILMPHGDGASFAAIWRIKKYLSAHPSNYKAFRNRVPPGPEIWHTHWTALNTIATNSYGPATSTDPSALSKSSTAAGAKRPTDLKKVDFFPSSRSMMLFFEARVLDCWRIFFQAEDIITYFQGLPSLLPELDSLWKDARTLVRRYASQEAYDQALSGTRTDSARTEMRIPRGTPWTAPIDLTSSSKSAEDSQANPSNSDDAAEETFVEPGEEAPEETVSDSEETATGKKKKKSKQKSVVHTEEPDFLGDRVIANEILFLQDFGFWAIAAHAVPDGEIGRIWEIMKVWTIFFSGSTNRNYANYLLESYCLHRYEASKEFHEAMLNNWLVNLNGHKWIELDFCQEDFNKWLEEMVEHKGGDFDDKFYRHTLAPNVFHFLKIKTQIEEAFELKHRSKPHGAPHLRNEFQQLLRMHKEDELHLFRPGRTMGRAAINYFGRGVERLEGGRMDKFIQDSTGYSDIMLDILQQPTEPMDPAADEAELQRLIQLAIDNPAMFPDEPEEDENDDEDEGGGSDDGGDIGIHGLEYPDDNDTPEGSHRRAIDETELETDDDEGGLGSEDEEEEMDEIIAEEEFDDYSTGEE